MCVWGARTDLAGSHASHIWVFSFPFMVVGKHTDGPYCIPRDIHSFSRSAEVSRLLHQRRTVRVKVLETDFRTRLVKWCSVFLNHIFFHDFTWFFPIIKSGNQIDYFHLKTVMYSCYSPGGVSLLANSVGVVCFENVTMNELSKLWIISVNKSL